MTPTLNYYNNIQNMNVVSGITSTKWFNLVKESKYSERITAARNGELDYNQTKRELPCITYNFLFYKYKKDANIISGTGLMYIDIDNPLFDVKLLDLTKVFAYHRSFGGSGYAIIIRVEGLTKDNFKTNYLNICDNLNLSSYIDINAIKASQFNVLSFDTNLFVNADSFVFNAINNLTPTSIVITREEKAYTKDVGVRPEYSTIRFNNLDEIDITGDYIVDWEGIEWVNCFIPMKRFINGRNGFLLSYTNNLVWLNPSINEAKLISILKKVSTLAFVEQVPEKDLYKVINSILKYKKDGSLKPIINTKPRKIIFNHTSKLTKDEKLSICSQELAKKRIGESRDKITSILEDWDFVTLGVITQEKIWKNTFIKVSKNTVEKYGKEFKEYITALNNDYNRNKHETQISN